MGRDEAEQALRTMAKDADELVAYFKIAALAGNTVPVPAAVLLKLCEVLQTSSAAMRSILESSDICALSGGECQYKTKAA